VSLTAEDRRWMDDVVKTVEETWNVVGPKVTFLEASTHGRRTVQERRELQRR
jgi:hypothetical protein